jgi:isoamylase
MACAAIAAKLLLDPYARAIEGSVVWAADSAENERLYDRRFTDNSRSDLDSAPALPRCVVVDERFDWGDDAPPGTARADTVIYEAHVRGLTKLMSALPKHLRGTYAGLGHELVRTYLRELGVTAVELMPVHQFLLSDYLHSIGKPNYWGYDTVGFFAPHNAYSASGDGGQQVTEFKQMVQALHSDGIEVLLDVVYNHTVEGGSGANGAAGPTFSLRGLDNASYYLLGPADRSAYVDQTGTGNTINIWDPAALRLILDSLRYWVTEMHVDGFRFDLLAVLAQTGGTHSVSTFLDAISQDPVLAEVKLIAEPWAALGVDLWSLGRLPPRWGQWNCDFRDDIRDYWKSAGQLSALRQRMLGSPDIFSAAGGERPTASVNYVVSHDSPTLGDLVSYTNGDQHAWGCGAEGPTDDPNVLQLRARQARNFLATTLLAQGIPMILHGDECGRTQNGQVDAYDIDDETTWLHWDAQDTELLAFTKRAISLRRGQPVFRRRRFFGGDDAKWFTPDGAPMTDWNRDWAHSVTLFLDGEAIPYPDRHGQPVLGDSFLLLFNAYWEQLQFTILPSLSGPWSAEIATETPDGTLDAQTPGTVTARTPTPTLNLCSAWPPAENAMRRVRVLLRVDANASTEAAYAPAADGRSDWRCRSSHTHSHRRVRRARFRPCWGKTNRPIASRLCRPSTGRSICTPASPGVVSRLLRAGRGLVWRSPGTAMRARLSRWGLSCRAPAPTVSATRTEHSQSGT